MPIEQMQNEVPTLAAWGMAAMHDIARRHELSERKLP